MALEANRASLSEGTTGKGAEPSDGIEQYDRSLARIQAKDRAYNEGLRSRKKAAAPGRSGRRRQIRNRKDVEQTVRETGRAAQRAAIGADVSRFRGDSTR